MGTDIYGVIEVREPFNALWPDQKRQWVECMNLYPIYPGNGYDGFGCLFGERNWAGWEPVAEGRSLPTDVSETVCKDYEHLARADRAVHGSTWISWPELRDLDMTVRLPARGILGFGDSPGDGTWVQCRIDDQWPNEFIAEYGLSPMSGSPADTPYGTWWQDGTGRQDGFWGQRKSKTMFQYKPTISRHDVLGLGTGWDHVFAVMQTLAHRFGDEGVRLIAWFD
ncbi:hypothetical protein AMIS_42220 [Actinoplanes missouriensis 431]|uniref:Uncharacterized protein n=1 Tax=Actinoplanes missouriensis (strain ATCC 14538 / DSM 43046 / CBS 188.64 / JCM 3121 / NBRC 102363 / NCIMB 12654 / NRRL B-3342 / UNCC 431) TaxID=512565 RepID=I0H8V5_ACTM4|nr:hypothetical protein [Actinoplanes missouriensis]BAL89442.1 hypothetical protein AMIS_42220 [Actinoplanes missouriensis 431]